MLTDGILKTGIAGLSGVSPAQWLRTWRESLLECLPAAWSKRLRREEARLILQLHGSGAAEARLEKGEERQPLGDLERGDSAGVKRILGRGQRAGAYLEVRVPAEAVLVQRFTLPAQVRDTLPRVLEYEIDRLTPFSAADLYFDYRLAPVRSRERLDVELAFTRRSGAESWLETLAAQGAAPRVLTWPGAWPQANLLPSAVRARRSGAGRGVGRLLWGTVLVLALAVLISPLWQKREVVKELQQLTADARKRSGQVVDLRQALENGLRSANYVLERKRGEPYVIEMLRRLTELVPDTSWVYQLDYKGGGKVQIRGESTQATALIELLAAEPAFRSIGFLSPVVGVPNTERERFHIGFDYAPEGRPE